LVVGGPAWLLLLPLPPPPLLPQSAKGLPVAMLPRKGWSEAGSAPGLLVAMSAMTVSVLPAATGGKGPFGGGDGEYDDEQRHLACGRR